MNSSYSTNSPEKYLKLNSRATCEKCWLVKIIYKINLKKGSLRCSAASGLCSSTTLLERALRTRLQALQWEYSFQS
jgi:hypothetical protein